MLWAILEITDGTDTVKLIRNKGDHGFHLNLWRPSISDIKDGGVWKNSALGDGRSMLMRRWGNAVESFDLSIDGYEQDDVITETQNLRRLLEKARDYWSPRAAVGPVWIKAQAACETNPRYAYIYNYQTPNDDNPYGAGFGGTTPIMQDFVLTIERGHWQGIAPNDSLTCIEQSSSMTGYLYEANLIANGGFETAGGGGADVFASWTESAGDGAIARNTVTYYLGAASALLTAGPTYNTYIQQNVAVVAGSVYMLCFRSRITGATQPRYDVLNITAGGSVIATTPIDYAYSGIWHHYAVLFTVPVGCVSVGVVLRPPAVNASVAYFDSVTVRKATALAMGQVSTCEQALYTPNKSSKAQISHIFAYDSSAATYSTNKIGAVVPFDILPNPLGANDILYIGIDDDVYYPGPFSNIVFDLLQAGAGTITGTWQYWNGAAWAALTYTGDLTNSLQSSGVKGLRFIPLSGWAKTTINGIYGYWIRLNITAITGAPVPQQQNQQIFSAIVPYTAIAAASVPGDISAPIKDTVNCSQEASGSNLYNVLLATRSEERGTRFDPYINISDLQQPAELQIVIGGVKTVITDAIDAPTGRCALFTAAGADSDPFYIYVTNPLCNHYFGAFRMLMRVRQLTGTAGTITIDGRIECGTAVITRSAVISASVGNFFLADLGKLTIPTFSADTTSQLESIEMTFTLTTTAACTLNLYDLIVIPVDECAVEVDGVDLIQPTFACEIDSTLPKKQVQALTKNSSGYIVNEGGVGRVISPNALELRGRVNQRMFTFALDRAYPYILTYNKVEGKIRYLSMRGAR